ncbi:hypothetical protein GOP47_0017050, partial [Adiantum capillus-veneris]
LYMYPCCTLPSTQIDSIPCYCFSTTSPMCTSQFIPAQHQQIPRLPPASPFFQSATFTNILLPPSVSATMCFDISRQQQRPPPTLSNFVPCNAFTSTLCLLQSKAIKAY